MAIGSEGNRRARRCLPPTPGYSSAILFASAAGLLNPFPGAGKPPAKGRFPRGGSGAECTGPFHFLRLTSRRASEPRSASSCPARSPKLSGRSIALRRLGNDSAIDLDCLLKRLFSFVALGKGDGLTPNPPELLDTADAPQRAFPRSPDRLAVDNHADWIGVHLRELPDGHPAAAVDPHGRSQVVRPIIGGHFFRSGHLAVDNQLDSALVSAWDGFEIRPTRLVQIHRVPN